MGLLSAVDLTAWFFFAAYTRGASFWKKLQDST
jgi:hypothetical protein